MFFFKHYNSNPEARNKEEGFIEVNENEACPDRTCDISMSAHGDISHQTKGKPLATLTTVHDISIENSSLSPVFVEAPKVKRAILLNNFQNTVEKSTEKSFSCFKTMDEARKKSVAVEVSSPLVSVEEFVEENCLYCIGSYDDKGKHSQIRSGFIDKNKITASTLTREDLAYPKYTSRVLPWNAPMPLTSSLNAIEDDNLGIFNHNCKLGPYLTPSDILVSSGSSSLADVSNVIFNMCKFLNDEVSSKQPAAMSSISDLKGIFEHNYSSAIKLAVEANSNKVVTHAAVSFNMNNVADNSIISSIKAIFNSLLSCSSAQLPLVMLDLISLLLLDTIATVKCEVHLGMFSNSFIYNPGNPSKPLTRKQVYEIITKSPLTKCSEQSLTKALEDLYNSNKDEMCSAKGRLALCSEFVSNCASKSKSPNCRSTLASFSNYLQTQITLSYQASISSSILAATVNKLKFIITTANNCCNVSFRKKVSNIEDAILSNASTLDAFLRQIDQDN